MPTCTCPFCAQTGLSFDPAEAQVELICPSCGGLFTPMSGVRPPPASVAAPPQADRPLARWWPTRVPIGSAIAAMVLWSILAAVGGFGGAMIGEIWGVASAGGAA